MRAGHPKLPSWTTPMESRRPFRKKPGVHSVWERMGVNLIIKEFAE